MDESLKENVKKLVESGWKFTVSYSKEGYEVSASIPAAGSTPILKGPDLYALVKTLMTPNSSPI